VELRQRERRSGERCEQQQWRSHEADVRTSLARAGGHAAIVTSRVERPMLASVESTYTDIVTSVFTTTIAAKAWLATAALTLGIVQVSTGARIFGKLQPVIRLPHEVVKRVHRWSGRLAILCTLPVAFHCIFILGFRTTDARVLAHSIVGSFVYGVIAVKIFFVHDRAHPRWVLPVVGGSLFTVLVTLWSTSGLWYFTNVRFGF
jgi:hypothetical protein